ncbi:MAG TPA: calcium/sodium antiporter [Anaerolineales bacterium]|nr:calcium/sodium antiporter [Anaerolineales bacterium]
MLVILFILGIFLLLGGGELLVRGASHLAASLGITPLIVGLTVVAFSTSAPELAVTIQSAYADKADIAFGNIVGSSITNILFILGLSATLIPLVVSQKLLWADVPLMIGINGLLYMLALDGQISRVDGLLLVGGIIAYIVFAIRQSRQPEANVQKEYAQEYGIEPAKAKQQWGLSLLFVGSGVLMLVLGAQWLVDGAVAIAKALGLSELTIGLTIVAVGTSLPEIATSIIASRRGESDIAVGNVVGSNIFNILCVLGVTAVVAPDGVSVARPALYFDLPVLLIASVACLPIFFIGHQINRWEGLLFLGYYVVYIVYLILNATAHDALLLLNKAVVWFVIPLTTITMAIYFWRSWQKQRKS